jgi:hypothetical protein
MVCLERGGLGRIRNSVRALMYRFCSATIWWGSKPCGMTVGVCRTKQRLQTRLPKAGETLSGRLRWVNGCTKALYVYIPASWCCPQ